MNNLAKAITKQFTESKPIVVDGFPDAHTIWIVVEQQSFRLDGYSKNKKHADWMRRMLGIALAKLCGLVDEKESSTKPMKRFDGVSDIRLGE